MSASLADEPAIRDERGRFLPGNPLWKLHAWAAGTSADRPNAWTPEECAHICADYIQDRLDSKRTITKAGLLVALGISHEALSNYSKGEYGKTPNDRRAYVEIFNAVQSVIEDQLEEQLSRDKGQVNGVIFRLKNHHGWRDEKHLRVDSTEERTIKIIAPEGSALQHRLSGVSGRVIEHDAE